MGIIVPFNHFDGTRDAIRPLERIDNIREAAKDFRATMLSQPKVLFYKTFELIRVPYPAKYGYLNAFSLPTPFIHLCNKLFVIQFNSDDGIKTLLVSPSDWENQRETPFFAQLEESAGVFSKTMEKIIFKFPNTVLGVLAQLGLKPEDIDYITYDHLHTQNVTRWLGGQGQAAIFPNAKLLVMREE